MIHNHDFPALYRSADDLSSESQRHFFFALKLNLIFLIIAAVLSVGNISHWLIAALQLLTLLSALFSSIYIFSKRPDRLWYAARAVAESVKTITWRYISRAEPFEGDDVMMARAFQQKLKAIVEQNREIARYFTNYLDTQQITQTMTQMRTSTLEERKEIYATHRIKDQLTWYAKKASFNKKRSHNIFLALITINSLAVVCAVFRIRFAEFSFWPTDIFVAISASLLTWMQAKRFSELAASYALAAHEIGLIREQTLLATSDHEFSQFVGDAENAFSREHTQWVARKDA